MLKSASPGLIQRRPMKGPTTHRTLCQKAFRATLPWTYCVYPLEVTCKVS